MTGSCCSSYQRISTAAAESGDGGNLGPSGRGERGGLAPGGRPPCPPGPRPSPSRWPPPAETLVVQTDVGASQKERLFHSSNQKNAQNVFFLTNALADGGRSTDTPTLQAWLSPLPSARPLLQDTGLGRLGAGLHGNTSGPSTTGTERVSGTEGEKRGPSPAPSFQKQVRNYKLEIETSNVGHGNQKL